MEIQPLSSEFYKMQHQSGSIIFSSDAALIDCENDITNNRTKCRCGHIKHPDAKLCAICDFLIPQVPKADTLQTYRQPPPNIEQFFISRMIVLEKNNSHTTIAIGIISILMCIDFITRLIIYLVK